MKKMRRIDKAFKNLMIQYLNYNVKVFNLILGNSEI